MGAREALLERVIAYATADGIADRSLREIAAGVGTSHRMLLYHFGSREGLLAAIVADIEARQRAGMADLATTGGDPRELMRALWRQVSADETRPFVKLFFQVFGLAVQGVPGTDAMLHNLTTPWVSEGVASAEQVGATGDPAAIRLGVAVSRGLLLDLLAGADPAAVDAAYDLFIELYHRGPAV